MNKLVTFTLGAYAQQNGFIRVSDRVLTNTNKYPMLAFTKADGTSEFLYFSRKMAGKVAEGQVVDAAFIKGLQVAETKNAAGETRYKLTGAGNSLDLASLLA